MIKASELRIGNLLSFSNGIEPTRIVTVGRRFFSSAAIEKEDGDFNVVPYYSGIALTEEYHNRFGVLKDGFHAFKYELTERKQILFVADYVYLKDISRMDGKPSTDDDLCVLWNKDIKQRDMYIHEWQNLYFALTGIELKLKDTK